MERPKTIEMMLLDLKERGFTRPHDSVDADGRRHTTLADQFDLARARERAESGLPETPPAAAGSARGNEAPGAISAIQQEYATLLAAQRSEITGLRSDVASVRAELETSRGTIRQLQATIAQHESGETLATLRSDLASAKSTEAKATRSLALLESLARVKGINPAAAPPALDDPAPRINQAAYEQRIASTTDPKEREAIRKEFDAACKAQQT